MGGEHHTAKACLISNFTSMSKCFSQQIDMCNELIKNVHSIN